MSSVIEELEKTYSIKYIKSLEFSSERIREKVKHRCQRKLKWKKHATPNRWILALYEEDLKRQKEIPFYLKKVNPLVGMGVYTKEPLPPGAYVGEYVGVVRRRHRRRDRDNDYVFGYVIGPHDTPWVIDAEEKGNFTRFLNHSYEPNLVSKWVILDGIAHIIFCTARRVAKDEQLTYDYGPYYWKKRPYPQTL